MTSTPRRIWPRTARRQDSAPSHRLSWGIAEWRSSARPRVASIWPEVVEMERPASTIRGASTSPRAAASRMARVAPEPSPRLRTVVKPASRVFLALARVRRVFWGAFSVTSSTRAATPPASESRWTWLSIRPGSTKRPERSTRAAPAGGGWRPSRTETIRPPWTVIVDGPRGGRPGRSSSRPAWITVTGPDGAGGAAGGWARDAEASRKMGTVTNFLAARRDIEQAPFRKIGNCPYFLALQLLDLGLERGELGAEAFELLLAAAASGAGGRRGGGAAGGGLEQLHVAARQLGEGIGGEGARERVAHLTLALLIGLEAGLEILRQHRLDRAPVE